MRSLLALLLVSSLSGCGVAPVRWDGAADPPPQWSYLGVHGRPLAYGGGVCAVATPHRHKYPPTPVSAFVETGGGWADTRPVHPFFNPHPHHGRTCHLERWHLHLEPPDAGLVFDESNNGWAVTAG